VVLIDTDVFLLAFAFHNDVRQSVNTSFLKRVQDADPAITIYNLLELLGQMSFNLAPNQLDNWGKWLVSAYRLRIVSTVQWEDATGMISFKTELFDRPYAKMRAQRMAFLDALVLDLAERTSDVGAFVTWNAKHFREKTRLRVMTPEEYLVEIS
jgi:hypothetical protein